MNLYASLFNPSAIKHLPTQQAVVESPDQQPKRMHRIWYEWAMLLTSIFVALNLGRK
jgi:hypothetical protein